MRRLRNVLFLGLVAISSPLVFAQEPAQDRVDHWQLFVESQWNKSFGQCLMTADEYSNYQNQWQNFRLLSTIRYNLLLEHWFKRQAPKQSAVEIDSAFQFQKIEAYMIDGVTSAEKTARVEKAVLEALNAELPVATAEEFRKRFGMLKNELSSKVDRVIFMTSR